MGEAIRIACKGAETIDPAALLDFQGNLKALRQEDYLRLRKQITDLGFSEPISVWRKGKQNFILNGHQRIRTVMKMIEDGWDCPPLPISIITAKTKNEAKRKLLALTASFGRFDGQGFYEFLADTDIRPEELFENYRFADFDLPAFTEEFFFEKGDAGDMGAAVDGATSNLNPDSMGNDAQPGGSHIRMVQLFFNEETQPEFLAMVEELQVRFKTDNLTDTVMEAVKYAHENFAAKSKTRRKSVGG